MSISTNGSVTWSAPSNIALIKYWGKKGIQLPCNPSLSLTLDKARTITSLGWKPGKGVTFLFNGEESKFAKRVSLFLNSLGESFSFLDDYELLFDSKNTFPHGAGIASSASAMASIALCILSMKEALGEKSDDFFREASQVARLGSGSACRSLYGGLVSWGGISQEFGSQHSELESMASQMKDAVLIVDSSEKDISSSEGHRLMVDHPYAEIRFAEARIRFKRLLKLLKEGSFCEAGELIEAEALGIHAMMMTSSYPYILMKPSTLKLIESIRAYRKESGVPLFFTLDAGPNVHLLYLKKDAEKVESWVESDLLSYCESWICDQMGQGPSRVSDER